MSSTILPVAQSERQTEHWLDVADFAGLYQVSSLGRVRSVDRSVNSKDGKTRQLRGRQIAPFKNKDGYLLVTLYCCGIAWRRPLSHVVFAAFRHAIPEGCEIHHANRKRSDNRESNLICVDATTHLIYHFRGERNPASKLDELLVSKIKELLAQGVSQRKIAAQLSVNQSTISRIKTGQLWGHSFTIDELPELSF